MRKTFVLWIPMFLAAAAAQEIPEMEYEGRHDRLSLETQIDFSAVLRTWRIKGVMVCTHGGETTTCLWVENAYPCGVFEVVRQPFRSHLKEGRARLELFAKLHPGLQSRHGEDLQFADVRAWTFVPELNLKLDLPLAIPDAAALELDYVSELDASAWRREWVDRVLNPAPIAFCEKVSNPKECAGRWGAYRPRAGFVTRGSEVMASCLQALRGGRVASQPAGRVILSRYDYEPRTGHYLQRISPGPGQAFSIGSSDVTGVERGAGSKRGAYLFVHFGVFEVCNGCLPVRLTEERMPE